MPDDDRTLKRPWLSPLVHLSNNWISLTGVVVVTTATIFWLFLLPSTFGGELENPYIGILAFMIVPAAFFGGLALIPLGIYLKERRERREGVYPSHFPAPNLRNPDFRRLAAFVVAATLVNIVIASQLTYGAVTYMDSVTFCGETCHTVMQPEYTAYQHSPHARVACVGCHIGPGASWFVRSKLSGTWQVFAATFETYPRPIPTPVANLRPARETCETCHWPQKYGADRVRIIRHFAPDEQNSRTQTVLLMKIGGGNRGIGIHGTHLGPGVSIRYRSSDASRQEIPWVEYRDSGRTTVYQTEGAQAGALPVREMDCIDCHNRPSHTFELPERALDNAMAGGFVSPSLPFARQQGAELLKAEYGSREQAAQRIPAVFVQYYQQKYPEVWAGRRAEVEGSAKAVLEIWNRNVFPHMRVTWGTYPNHIGHTDFPGCFRCHDGTHVSADGKSIQQDCNSCHTMLAVEEADPKILTDLGITEGRAPGEPR
ncbi:MAG TPA: NapC/NirT family cytochrome c [Bryobacteraceae bacterium]|nr:NapC/NirT family cytochrome c [Bryobacteraceae bacterium]